MGPLFGDSAIVFFFGVFFFTVWFLCGETERKMSVDSAAFVVVAADYMRADKARFNLCLSLGKNRRQGGRKEGVGCYPHFFSGFPGSVPGIRLGPAWTKYG